MKTGAEREERGKKELLTTDVENTSQSV